MCECERERCAAMEKVNCSHWGDWLPDRRLHLRAEHSDGTLTTHTRHLSLSASCILLICCSKRAHSHCPASPLCFCLLLKCAQPHSAALPTLDLLSFLFSSIEDALPRRARRHPRGRPRRGGLCQGRVGRPRHDVRRAHGEREREKWMRRTCVPVRLCVPVCACDCVSACVSSHVYL